MSAAAYLENASDIPTIRAGFDNGVIQVLEQSSTGDDANSFGAPTVTITTGFMNLAGDPFMSFDVVSRWSAVAGHATDTITNNANATYELSAGSTTTNNNTFTTAPTANGSMIKVVHRNKEVSKARHVKLTWSLGGLNTAPLQVYGATLDVSDIKRVEQSDV